MLNILSHIALQNLLVPTENHSHKSQIHINSFKKASGYLNYPINYTQTHLYQAEVPEMSVCNSSNVPHDAGLGN